MAREWGFQVILYYFLIRQDIRCFDRYTLNQSTGTCKLVCIVEEQNSMLTKSMRRENSSQLSQREMIEILENALEAFLPRSMQ